MGDLLFNKNPPESPVDTASEADVWSVTLPAQFSSLDDVRGFFGRAAAQCGLDSAAVYAVQLAVDEAFTNIVEHAFGGECLEEVECVCRIAPDALTVVLKDCGSPFDPRNIPEPNLSSDLQQRKVGGLGLYFMRQLMDEVEFTFHTEAGGQVGCNVLRMVKRKEKK
jgi:serine/threonine-protein kinase RsbW